jgi:hypothetical protein
MIHRVPVSDIKNSINSSKVAHAFAEILYIVMNLVFMVYQLNVVNQVLKFRFDSHVPPTPPMLPYATSVDHIITGL